MVSEKKNGHRKHKQAISQQSRYLHRYRGGENYAEMTTALPIVDGCYHIFKYTIHSHRYLSLNKADISIGIMMQKTML